MLLVDDDAAFRKTLAGVLGANGFSTLEAANGLSGIRKAAEEKPALVILDLVMPDLRGTDVCRKLKSGLATAGIPILMLTGNDREGQEVACLDMGADDYLTKPVRTERLLAHCRALLRRLPAGTPQRPPIVTLGRLRLDYERKVVVLGARDYPHLTPKEFELLYCLAGCSPHPRQRAELYREVWGTDPPSEMSLRTVEVHVRRIRLKLGWKTGQWLAAVSGRGYCLVAA